jgi:hypothetical protein
MRLRVDDLIGNCVAVHCDTEDKAKQLMQYFEDNGVLWRGGGKPSEYTNWNVYEEQSCYSMKWGLEELSYAGKDFLEKYYQDYQIAEFEDIDIPSPKRTYTIDDLVGEKIVVQCDTEDKANKLLQYFEDNGARWCGISKPTEDNNWHIYEKKTSYALSYGLKALTYDDVDMCTQRGFKKIQFEDVDIPSIKRAYTINNLVSKKIAVHCDTEEEAKQLMQYFEGNSVIWVGGNKATEEIFWHKHRDETCYTVVGGLKRLTYGDVDWFTQGGFKIIQFEDVDISNNKSKVQGKMEEENMNELINKVVGEENVEIAKTFFEQIKDKIPNKNKVYMKILIFIVLPYLVFKYLPNKD